MHIKELGHVVLRSAGYEQNRIEKLKNEMISRRDDESVLFAQ